MAGNTLSGVANPTATTTLYGALGGASTTSDLYTIDSGTGAATSVGAIGFSVTGLSFRPSDGVLFGVTSANSASNPKSLITVDTITGAGTLVGSLGGGVNLADIAFRSDDALYGYYPTNRTLYSVDTTTGTATQVSATAIPTSGQGYGDSFDSTDTLYVFPKGTAGAFYIVDEGTGGLTAQTALSGSSYTTGVINAASFDAADLCWVCLNEAGPVWHIATVNVGTSTITEVGVTTDQMDAIVWSPV